MKEQNYLDNLVGVFGHPAAENPGVVIQEAAFRDLGLQRWHFLTIDVDPGKLGDAILGLRAMKFRGINCTIPHKIEVLKYIDRISPSAELIGAVNTIVNDNGVLTG
ncbi:MAG TPA: shikimate dehydrogenase, partial [Rectinemataceae bacterium]|nr:shikimate dehydrogenase [Rectinemataceae bacterium]